MYDLESDPEYIELKATGMWQTYGTSGRTVDEFVINGIVNRHAIAVYVDELVGCGELPADARDDTRVWLARYVELQIGKGR